MNNINNKKVSDLTVGELLALFKKYNKEANQELTSLLNTLGISPKLKGYHYILFSLKQAIDDPKSLEFITKSLYPQIAKKYETTPSSVERAIRYAIEISFDRGNIEVIQEIFGYTVNISKGRPTNSEFFSVLTNYLRTY